jgi:hypothetical protein
MTVVEFFASIGLFIKSEFERHYLTLFYFSDLNKPFFLVLDWGSTFLDKALDSFLYGFLENNIGHFKFYTKL